jgi:hypothetical protein
LNVPFFSCFAHTLNLIVEKGLEDVDFNFEQEQRDDEDESEDELPVSQHEAKIRDHEERSRNGCILDEDGQQVKVKPGLQKLIAKVRKLVGAFNSSDNLTRELIDDQVAVVINNKLYKKVKLIQDIRIRYK